MSDPSPSRGHVLADLRRFLEATRDVTLAVTVRSPYGVNAYALSPGEAGDAARERLSRLVESFRTVAQVVDAAWENGPNHFTVPALPFCDQDSGGRLLSERELALVDAAVRAAAVLTGEELARAAGCPYDATTRATLAALRRRGYLGGKPHEAGYPPLRRPSGS